VAEPLPSGAIAQATMLVRAHARGVLGIMGRDILLLTTTVTATATGIVGNGMMWTRGLEETAQRSKAATGQTEAILGTTMRGRCKQEGLGEGLRVVGGMGEKGFIFN